MDNFEALLKNIAEGHIRVVSFDIFDTLLMRIGAPSTILELSAAINNIPTEVYMQSRSWNGGWWSPIDKQEQMPNMPESTRAKCRNTEMELEYQTLRPRKTIQKLFHRIIQMDVDVIITSDMYLPQDFIEKLLVKNDYRDYKKLYLSKKGKATKEIYRKIIDDYSKQSISPEEIVHIGDHYQVDYKNAIKCGLKAIHCPSAFQLFNSSDLGKNIKQRSLGDKLQIGLLADILFDDPFVNYQGYLNGSTVNLSYIIASFLADFTIWFVNNSNHHQRDLLLLISRDGDILDHLLPIYSQYLQIPEYKDFYLSRRMRAPAIYLNEGANKDNLLYSKDYFNPDFFIEKNRLTVLKKVMKYNLTGKISKEDLVYINKSFDKSLLKKRYKILTEYIDSVVSGHTHIALFDVGYNSSALKYLERYQQSLEDVQEYQIIGKPYTLNTMNFIEQDSARRYLHLDNVVKSTDKAAEYVEKKGSKFVIHKSGYENISILNEFTQQTAIDYSILLTDLFGPYLNKIIFSQRCFWDLVIDICHSSYPSDQSVVSLFSSKKVTDDAISVYTNKHDNSSNGVFNACMAQYFQTLKQHDEVENYLLSSYESNLDYVRIKLFDHYYKHQSTSQDNLVELLSPLLKTNDCGALLRMGQLYHYMIKTDDNLIKSRSALQVPAYLCIGSALTEYIKVLTEIDDEYSSIELLDILEPACISGNSLAMITYARFLRTGHHVQKDLNKAAYWMKNAMDAGVDAAHNELFDILWEINTPQSHLEMIDIAFKYANEGDGGAIGRIAKSYRFGIGFQKNPSEAIKWYKKASEKGIKWAKLELFDTIWELNDSKLFPTMIESIKELCTNNNPAAKARMGRAFRDGKGVNKDLEKAKQYLKYAGEHGIKWAMKEYHQIQST